MTEHIHQGGVVTGPNGDSIPALLSPGEHYYKIIDGKVVDVAATPVARRSKVARWLVRYIRTTARDMLVGMVAGLRMIAAHPIIVFMLCVQIALLVMVAHG